MRDGGKEAILFRSSVRFWRGEGGAGHKVFAVGGLVTDSVVDI